MVVVFFSRPVGSFDAVGLMLVRFLVRQVYRLLFGLGTVLQSSFFSRAFQLFFSDVFFSIRIVNTVCCADGDTGRGRRGRRDCRRRGSVRVTSMSGRRRIFLAVISAVLFAEFDDD